MSYSVGTAESEQIMQAFAAAQASGAAPDSAEATYESLALDGSAAKRRVYPVKGYSSIFC